MSWRHHRFPSAVETRMKQGSKQPRWLIGAALAGLAVLVLLILRPRPAPVVTPVANQSNAAQSGELHPSGASGVPGATAPDLTSTSGPDDWAMEGYNPARTRAIEAGLVLPMTQQRVLAVAGDDGD